MTETNSETDIDELVARTTKIDLSDLLCPICADVFVIPRTYDCGHTVCESCMYQIDIRQLSDDTHVAVIYKCPVCRNPTLKSWNNRPLNFLLEQLSSRHPDYEKRKKEVIELKKQRKSQLISISDTVDLAKTSHVSRINLALDLYDILLEKLYIAAKEGKNHLIIKEKSIVSEIEKVGDILSYQLFYKHNVYRILTTRGECTIYLTRNAFAFRRNFVNSEWLDPTDPTLDEMRGPQETTIPIIPVQPPPTVETHSPLVQETTIPIIPVQPPPTVETHSPLVHRRNYIRSPVTLSTRNFTISN